MVSCYIHGLLCHVVKIIFSLPSFLLIYCVLQKALTTFVFFLSGLRGEAKWVSKVRGTRRLFSVNICSKKQILPRNFDSSRKAKNF